MSKKKAVSCKCYLKAKSVTIKHNGKGTTTSKSSLSESKDRTADYLLKVLKLSTAEKSWTPAMGLPAKIWTRYEIQVFLTALGMSKKMQRSLK